MDIKFAISPNVTREKTKRILVPKNCRSAALNNFPVLSREGRRAARDLPHHRGTPAVARNVLTGGGFVAWRIAVCKTSPAPLSATILSGARPLFALSRLDCREKKGGHIYTRGWHCRGAAVISLYPARTLI